MQDKRLYIGTFLSIPATFRKLAFQIARKPCPAGREPPDISQRQIAQRLFIEGGPFLFFVISCHAPFLCHSRV